MRLDSNPSYLCEIDLYREALLVLDVELLVMHDEFLLLFPKNIQLVLRNDSVVFPECLFYLDHAMVPSK